ncbi:RecQ-mediated genome instability protein 2 [Frankliniella fusca]|uniref:RecQ-mediated genome instability protein 2 n=1 Tax=Frankliniella fusca TaxID=407009 RepID=A0AAE1HD10_9NEOP|nr:RecQ-mediated genome instability protein 2 [Frankliniella fusca]
MTLEPALLSQDAPLKLLVRDIRNIQKSKLQAYPWKIQNLKKTSDRQPLLIQFNQIWLQGWVKNCENDGENILVSDGTGEVKVTKCSRSPGYNWIKQGSYCGILASVKFPSQLPPEVEALKFMHISEKTCEAERMWPLEVEELMNVLGENITFHQ